jgi:hypothetical protein
MMLRTHRLWWGCALALVGVMACSGVVACSGEDQASGVGTSKLPKGHSETTEHEACNESGNRVEVLDSNGDGKPDIKRIYDKSSGKEVCRISDLNHDGKPDLYEYYDSNGVIRRREADYENNGVIDSIEYFEGGKLVRREYDTTGQHRIDTWDYFDRDSGRHLRRERDTNNDGKVDQWWSWDGDKVTIVTDKNGDGKPDPETTLVLGGAPDSGLGPPVTPATPPVPPPASSGPSAAPPASQPSDNTPLDAGAAGGEAGAPPKRKGR